ncbi:hypothetical protein [Mycobacterium shimoidei]|uniref:Uncharacterized protein n=1 Tax=Mycobacterium shimoidei TaxID=29313 RepID=A0A375YT37_MYCSH|nr:hypothetical protein [Mycobacterium shimoidei]SRX91992.1 hypothetical protein MSP7336_00213 [Mycobacterium shimoidei]
MSPWLIVLVSSLSLGVPLAGAGLLRVQQRLERWDYERHAQD